MRAVMTRCVSVVLWSLLWVARQETNWASGDLVFSEVPTTIAFGSCAKQYRKAKAAKMWKTILAENPDVWLWTGDAVYPTRADMPALTAAYKEMSTSPDYLDFAKRIPIVDGIIDDHDYGLNDGGKNWKHKETAKQLFLNFLNVAENSPRRARDGTYTSHTYGEPPYQVKVIMLDTRYNRDDHYYHSLSRYVQLSGGVSAFIRYMCAFTGLGFDYAGDMLGENQWRWLEHQLKESQANVNVVVSSVQITTSFAPMESWGHYPVARRRLFQLLQTANPRALLFLSGDVHFAQILGRDGGVLEVTSSGLTHCVVEYVGMWHLAELFLMPDKKRYYTHENFGILNVTFSDVADSVVQTKVNVIIKNSSGDVMLTANQTFRSDDDPAVQLQSLNDVPPLILQHGLISRLFRRALVITLTLWILQLLALMIYRIWLNMMRYRRVAALGGAPAQYHWVPPDDDNDSERQRTVSRRTVATTVDFPSQCDNIS